jgi:RNA polymerase sigma factor (sigma-70 family)
LHDERSILVSATTTQLLDGLFDPEADDVWQAFDRRYRPIIVGFAHRIGLDDESSAEIAQETLTRFVAAYRDGKYDRERGRLRSWIIGIAKHLIADHCARRERARGGDEIHGVDGILADEARLTQIWETERRASLLAPAMDELRSGTRTSPQSIRAFELVAFGRRSPDDVARELGMTRHDVYVAKHRVTERLREIVSRLEALCDVDG